MTYWRVLLVFVAFGLLGACASPPATDKDTAAPTAARPPAIAVTDLDCAEIRQNDPLSLVYRSQSIYRHGAVLPSREGLACLDTLSGWLKNAASRKWQVKTGGETDTGFDPQALAGKRLELLQRFFLRKGLDTSGWLWQAEAGLGAQLQLTNLP